MSNQDTLMRFEELEAGRILGDLDTEETQEWQKLSEELDRGPDLSLELVAAALDTEFAGQQEQELPDQVAEQLRRQMSDFAAGEEPKAGKIIALPFWSSPQVAWGLAALFAVLFVAGFLAKGPEGGDGPVVIDQPKELTPAESRDKLLEGDSDLIQTKFGGLGSYESMSGQVVWSDARQEGYMTLTDLPANNPTKNQYQLWIVDPARDEKPVDGGVFDIPAGAKTAVIPIRNPLAVTKPQAFVITLEQPGGVVVSKQEVVVALAKS